MFSNGPGIVALPVGGPADDVLLFVASFDGALAEYQDDPAPRPGDAGPA